MRILVTGGAGFIASHFYDRLIAAGHEIVNCDLVESPHARARAYACVDVRDQRGIERTMAGCDAVLHLAAAHHDFGIAEETYFDVNQGSAEVLCRAMDRHGIRDVCFYSTVAVYGDAAPPLDERAEPRPASLYGRSKLAAEEVFRRWTTAGDGRRCVVIRPTATIGPRHFANMYALIRQIESGRFIPVGDGRNIKSLAYVDNLVDATLHLWPTRWARGERFEVFNYVDKPDLTSAEIAETIYAALGRRPPPVTVPLSLALMLALPFDLAIALSGRNLPISSQRVRKLATAETKFEADKIFATGFQPRVPLREGLRRMVEWYLAEGKDQAISGHRPPPAPVLHGDR